MNTNTLGAQFLKELEEEMPASHKCVERISEDCSDWKPHEKSMPMGYLTLLVAEVPLWIATMAEGGEIDFATWQHAKAQNGPEYAKHLEENMARARKALSNISDQSLDEPFSLKNNGVVIMTSSRKDFISSSIRHMVHHRGQLTVYMRLKGIPVPALYGPSADDNSF